MNWHHGKPRQDRCDSRVLVAMGPNKHGEWVYFIEQRSDLSDTEKTTELRVRYWADFDSLDASLPKVDGAKAVRVEKPV
jgi:hypothetical protein